MEAQISTLDMLRSRFPDFLTALPNITKENLQDNKFLIKYLTNPYNRNGIKNALRSELSLSPTQQIDLEQTLNEKFVAAEEVGGQSTSQETQPAGAAGSSAGNMPFGGMSSASPVPFTPRRIFVTQQTPPASGMEGGTDQNMAATNKAGQRFNFSTFRSKVGSKITGAAKTGLERANPFLKRMGNGGIKALSGMANLGGGHGGVFSSLGRFSQRGGREGSIISKAKGRGGLIFAGSIIGLMLLTGTLAIMGTTPTGEAAPISNTVGLDYTLPLKNTSVQPVDIKAQVKTTFPGAKLEYWDKIVQSSVTAGFNPALALALWIEETGASQTTLAKNDGSEIPVNGAFTRGHLGCAPTEDQTMDESLSCLFKFMAANNFTNDQFADFMAKYSGGPANAPFSNNPDFPKNIKDWYTRLVPAGTGAIVAVTPSSPPKQAIASCPVAEGHISTPSYNANPSTGHCGGSYSYACKCGTSGRRAKAIDVPTNGQSVILPTIENQQVTWRLIVGPYAVDSGEGGGLGYTFQATLGGNSWYLDMLHLNQSPLALGGEYPSGTPVAKSAITHVHMTIGKNLSSAPVAGSPTDCDPNWLPSDFLCQ